jgi:hypothetical protein
MQAEETVLDTIKIRKLKWFQHLMRMPEEREMDDQNSCMDTNGKEEGMT